MWKPGDEICIEQFGHDMEVATLTKVTPSGIATDTKGRRWLLNGRQQGNPGTRYHRPPQAHVITDADRREFEQQERRKRFAALASLLEAWRQLGRRGPRITDEQDAAVMAALRLLKDAPQSR